MIPADFIIEWRAHTRWALNEQIEQDLVLSRALVTIFQDPVLAGALALRGGTALHKLFFSPARRYSEDIDLVQLDGGAFGPMADRLRALLDPWLGVPRREWGQGVKLIYRFDSEIPPVVPLRLKIETNTREHIPVRGIIKKPLTIASRWWNGAAEITTYGIEELLGTKLRALFQRKKGRDLFDLALALNAGVDPAAIVEIFLAYTKAEGRDITRAIFEENLDGKMRLPAFANDIPILLPPDTSFDVAAGMAQVSSQLVTRLPGEPWTRPSTR